MRQESINNDGRFNRYENLEDVVDKLKYYNCDFETVLERCKEWLDCLYICFEENTITLRRVVECEDGVIQYFEQSFGIEENKFYPITFIFFGRNPQEKPLYKSAGTIECLKRPKYKEKYQKEYKPKPPKIRIFSG